MGHIYFELPESEVPEGSHSDGDRVYMLGDIGRSKIEKIYIGVYARKDELPQMFYPNEKFRQFFPSLWEKRYGDKLVAKHIIGIGIYEITLGIGHATGLYRSIHDSFGPFYGNLILDYAMYSIMDCKNVAYLFKPAMENTFLFSKDRMDDDKLSDVFSKKITHEMIEEFKARWVRNCVDLGINEVWLSIDGSNSNYESANSNLSQKGKAKSRKNVEIVSYIWAVSAKDGLPVTFAVNDGSTSDSKAFDEIITFLSAYGIKVKGVILDKGFLTITVLRKIMAARYDFVVNLKEDSHGTKSMLEDYGKEIYWNIEHLAGKGGLFGIVSEKPRKIFQKYPEEAYIALYFDGKNGSERKITLADKIDTEIVRIEAIIANGEKPSVSKEMTRYLSVIETVESPSAAENSANENEKKDTAEKTDFGKDKDISVDVHNKKFSLSANKKNGEADFWSKGFCALASSTKMTAREMNMVYHIRDASEKQFMICKTMLGFSVLRAHSDKGIEAREVICFIASVIRNRISVCCKCHGLKTARIIEDIDNKLFLLLNSSGGYSLVNKLTDNQKKVLNDVGVGESDISAIAGEVCFRIRKAGKGISQFHDSPEEIRKRNKEGQKEEPGKTNKAPTTSSINDVTHEPRKVGRPPGRKNDRTLKREAANGSIDSEKRKVGRPKGRKNDSTLEREARERASGLTPPEKRPRGRPLGRKDSKPRKRRTKAELNALRNTAV